jgi:hypothetical protein
VFRLGLLEFRCASGGGIFLYFDDIVSKWREVRGDGSRREWMQI